MHYEEDIGAYLRALICLYKCIAQWKIWFVSQLGGGGVNIFAKKRHESVTGRGGGGVNSDFGVTWFMDDP